MQEYFSAITRKLAVAPETAQQKVEILAIELHARISFWDALIVHAARSTGTAGLYSEDFPAETVFGKYGSSTRFRTVKVTLYFMRNGPSSDVESRFCFSCEFPAKSFRGLDIEFGAMIL